MPTMRLREWLLEKVGDPLNRNLLWWVNEQKGLLAIHWKHASFEDYDDEKDSVLFKLWAQENNRYDPDAEDSAEERKRWKTNFRCALNSATNIKKGEQSTKIDKRQNFRLFELLDRPDPLKVRQKQKSNKLAAKSKQKPINQKRAYNSRLNKSATYMKQESKERHHDRDTRSQKKFYPKPSRFQKSAVKEEFAMDISLSKSLRPADVQCYDESQPKPNACEDALPATLDAFHEEDEKDSGYYSASDSSSVGSSDFNTSQQSPHLDILNENSSIPPVETMLRDRVYNITSLPSYYDSSFTGYSPLSEGYILHDNQMVAELDTPNVCTEMIMQQDDDMIPMSVQTTEFDGQRSYMTL